ncbi:hypothetical protein BT69DRAFT_923418 [Atractiella rhizophila]|nr:hypothetical protein BT69DRAFT_923418 [Atractiella rhizophila]
MFCLLRIYLCISLLRSAALLKLFFLSYSFPFPQPLSVYLTRIVLYVAGEFSSLD